MPTGMKFLSLATKRKKLELLDLQSRVLRDTLVLGISALITAVAALVSGTTLLVVGVEMAKFSFHNSMPILLDDIATKWMISGVALIAVAVLLANLIVWRSLVILRDLYTKRFPYLDEKQINAGLLLLDSLPLPEAIFRKKLRLPPSKADEVVRSFQYFGLIRLKGGIVDDA